MSDPMLHPEIECLGAGDLERLQHEKWDRQWERVRARSVFYRRKLGPLASRSIGLERLAELPLTDKEELRASQEAEPPYGDYVACGPDRIIRIHRTSGTTGRALNLAYSRSDADIVAALGGRSMIAAGVRPGDRIVHCLNYQLWTGGVTDHLCIEASGATAVPFGVGSPRRLLETILELGITGISCTPSYPALLEQVARDELGRRPRDLGLRIGLFGGEAGLDNAGFRARLEETWGLKARNANFGLSEVMSIIGGQCDHTGDLHLHARDSVHVELLDPVTGQPQRIGEGTVGELVCTHLDRECQPLVRYRARDVLTVTGTGPCACGRTAWRFRVTGRTDDMFNVRGINVFPTAVQAVIAASPALCSGHFRIVLPGPGPYDRLRLTAEVPDGLAPERWEGAARELERKLKERIGASAEVTPVGFETLPRTAGKTSLIERR